MTNATTTWAALTTHQRRALSAVGLGANGQTDAHVLGTLRAHGLSEEVANEAIDSLLDLGLVRATVCARRDERFGHLAMLVRV